MIVEELIDHPETDPAQEKQRTHRALGECKYKVTKTLHETVHHNMVYFHKPEGNEKKSKSHWKQPPHTTSSVTENETMGLYHFDTISS